MLKLETQSLKHEFTIVLFLALFLLSLLSTYILLFAIFLSKRFSEIEKFLSTLETSQSLWLKKVKKFEASITDPFLFG